MLGLWKESSEASSPKSWSEESLGSSKSLPLSMSLPGIGASTSPPSLSETGSEIGESSESSSPVFILTSSLTYGYFGKL